LRFSKIHIALFFFATTSLLALTECTKDRALLVDPKVDCDTVPASWSADVASILEQKCGSGLGPGTGCHDSWAFDWELYDRKNQSGRIENHVLFLQDMPPIPNDFGVEPLTVEEKNKVNCWILNGWPNN